jgi:predicted glycosyltransferase
MIDRSFRILLYSHDTHGLGHFRRCQSIARAIASRFPLAQIRILTGSPVSEAYGDIPNAELIHLPPVKKLPDGTYRAAGTHDEIGAVRLARERVIRTAVTEFNPDICVVDKEPLGFLGEMAASLRILRKQGTHCVLGLRDILDEPSDLKLEWKKKRVPTNLGTIYDQIWIYGTADFYDPLNGLDLEPETGKLVTYTGFIDRFGHPPTTGHSEKHVLVTAGGGGDGDALMQAVLETYLRVPDITGSLVMLLGPFLAPERRNEISALASQVEGCTVMDFHITPEKFIQDAKLVIGMCGYNTFCEVMTYDKRALFVPRSKPRREQTIRAERATELGMCDMIDIEDASDPAKFALAIQAATIRARPSASPYRLDFDGLDEVCNLIGDIVSARQEPLKVVTQA